MSVTESVPQPGSPMGASPPQANLLGRAQAGLSLGWSVTWDAIADFVIADLRDGVLDLRGLGSTLRAVVWLGFGLMLLVVLAMLEGDLWRQSFPLAPLTQGIPGRGRLVPIAVVPATFFLLSLAWAFVLSGALRAHPAIKLGVLLLWILNLIGGMINTTGGSLWSLATGVLSLLAVVLTFTVCTWTRPRQVTELLILLLLVSAGSVASQAQGLESWRASGMPVMVSRVSFDMISLSTIITPMLLLVGMQVAGFAHTLAGWVTGIAEHRFPVWVPWVLLAVVLPWRLYEVVTDARDLVQTGPVDAQMIGFASGLLVPVLVGLVWWGLRAIAPRPQPIPEQEEIASSTEQLAPPLVVAYSAPLLLVVLMTGLALALAVLSLFARSLAGVQASVLGAVGVLTGPSGQFWWHFAVGLAGMVLAVWLARRGRGSGALFLGVWSVLDVKSRLSVEGRPLEWFAAAGPGDHTALWWVILFGGLALYWLLRRELTPTRASALAFVTLISLLLHQTDFISNRFSPFVDSSGIGFIAFGIIWDALTIGAWANVGSRALPRVSRIYLYLGYVLMTVTVINWAVASHDLAAVGRLTGDVGMVGLESYGKPLLYAMYVVTLARALRGTPTSDPDAADLNDREALASESLHEATGGLRDA